MSLINEALKKAQKQRAHEPTLVLPSGAPPVPHRVIKRAQPMAAQKLVLISAFCVLLFVIVGGGVWFIFSQVSAPVPSPTFTPKPTTMAKDGLAAAPADATSAAAPTDTTGNLAATGATDTAATTKPDGGSVRTDSTATTSPAPSVPPPSHVAAGDASTPKPGQTRSTEPATVTASTAPTEAPIDLTPSPTPRPIAEPKVQVLALVDSFKVAGIRASTSDPKVLMNDRVFRINDTVERVHGLRVTEINPDRIIFVDDAGATYTKTF